MSTHLNDPVFPVPTTNTAGTTKHEYAAIQIASSMASGTNDITEEEQIVIADRAYSLAEKVLNKFK